MYSYTMKGFTYPDFHVTLQLSGANDITDMNSLDNLVVTQDKTAANTVKLAGAGDEVLGVIFKAEDGRSQGEGISVTVALKGGYAVPYAGDTAPALGSMVKGAAGGKIAAAGSSDTVASHGRIWEVDTAAKTAVVYFE